MDYEIVARESFRIGGLQTELTRSQKENFKIIRGHWQRFNYALKQKKVKVGRDWQKYGITQKFDDRYFYLTAVPADTDIPGFVSLNIAQQHFACFQHKGRMDRIGSTIFSIYKETLPASNLQIDLDRTLLHYEHYDHRFQWNRSDSIIDILLPIELS